MWTLGINAGAHDAAACLLRDDEVVFAVAEERLSRVEHAGGFPTHAIWAALARAAIDPDQITAIGLSQPSPILTVGHDLLALLRRDVRPSWRWLRETVLGLVRSPGGSRSDLGIAETIGLSSSRPVFRPGHHYCHALGAAAMSDAPELVVLVADRRGSRTATSLWVRRYGRLHLLERKLFPDSLGLFFARVTQYLGFRPFAEEWKVVELATRGERGCSMEPFLSVGEDDYLVDGARLLGDGPRDLSALERAFGPARRPETPIEDLHRDVAFAAQEAIELAMLALARRAVALSGCRVLALAGGLALNARVCGRLVEAGLVDQVVVHPAAADDGSALGAALAAQLALGGQGRISSVGRVDWGREEGDAAIEALLAECGLAYRRTNDPAAVAADRLARGRSVGWFQGRSEFGPRALGQRSVLLDPRDPRSADRAGRILQDRWPWRPCAAVVLRERAGEFFDGCEGTSLGTTAYRIRQNAIAQVPAVIGTDGMATVQTVDQESSPLLRRLIERFCCVTGVPMVLNTAFRVREEPIVDSGLDALRAFFTSGLDSLVIGSFSVDKQGA
jgi:carbamoyltransferase